MNSVAALLGLRIILTQSDKPKQARLHKALKRHPESQKHLKICADLLCGLSFFG